MRRRSSDGLPHEPCEKFCRQADARRYADAPDAALLLRVVVMMRNATRRLMTMPFVSFFIYHLPPSPRCLRLCFDAPVMRGRLVAAGGGSKAAAAAKIACCRHAQPPPAPRLPTQQEDAVVTPFACPAASFRHRRRRAPFAAVHHFTMRRFTPARAFRIYAPPHAAGVAARGDKIRRLAAQRRPRHQRQRARQRERRESRDVVSRNAVKTAWREDTLRLRARRC